MVDERTLRGREIVSGSTVMLPLSKKPLDKEHIIYYEGGSVNTNVHTEGVIMRTSSILCHMAIHCRERNLPCIGEISFNLEEADQAEILYDRVNVILKEREIWDKK